MPDAILRAIPDYGRHERNVPPPPPADCVPTNRRRRLVRAESQELSKLTVIMGARLSAEGAASGKYANSFAHPVR
jgi:hypothetical protein